MALITWTKEQFGTNIGIADDQHKVLFNMLNELHELAAGSDRAAIGKSLDALVKYVVDHFATEEKLMQMHNYPNFDAHKAEHTKLLETCGGLAAKFHAGEAEITQETTTFVKDWLCSHIPKVDQHYGPFLNGKGVA